MVTRGGVPLYLPKQVVHSTCEASIPHVGQSELGTLTILAYRRLQPGTAAAGRRDEVPRKTCPTRRKVGLPPTPTKHE